MESTKKEVLYCYYVKITTEEEDIEIKTKMITEPKLIDRLMHLLGVAKLKKDATQKMEDADRKISNIEDDIEKLKGRLKEFDQLKIGERLQSIEKDLSLISSSVNIHKMEVSNAYTEGITQFVRLDKELYDQAKELEFDINITNLLSSFLYCPDDEKRTRYYR